ncbi:RxLR effector protein, partial [Phytophthora megakarya]
MVNKKYPDKQVSLAGTLSSRYGDDTVATTLVSAMPVENTMLLRRTVNLSTMFPIYSRLVTNPKLEVLHEYIGLFNIKKPHEETKLFSVLKNGFGRDGKLL